MIFDGKTLGEGILWPDGKRIAVMLTFDVDFEYLRITHLANKGQRAGFGELQRGDYGREEGLARCLALLKKHGIKGTFFVPGIIAEKYPDKIRSIFEAGHEIAYHGYEHEAKRGISKQEEEAIMEKGEAALMAITGKRPVGHRAPCSMLHPEAYELMEKRGYLYSSNMKDCDFAYLYEKEGKRPVIELPTDIIVDDFTYYFFSLCTPAHRVGYTNEEFMGTLKLEFDGLAEERDKILCIKLHPQLIGRAGRIMALDKLIGYMKQHGAWFAACEEVADYVLHHRSGEVSA